jgi:hypothetical protein
VAESTLSLTFEDLARSTAFYLGWGRKADAAEGLTAGQVSHVLAANNAGYRKFLGSFEWSFLYPSVSAVLFGTVNGTAEAGLTTTVTATTALFFPTMIGQSIVFDAVAGAPFTAGNSYTITGYTSSTIITVNTTAAADSSRLFRITPNGQYRLADDFGGVYGNRVRFSNDEGWVKQLTITAEGIVGGYLQGSTSSARPEYVAFRPLTTDGVTGQRFEMLTWPIPDSNYTVRFRQLVNPNALLTTLYPYGGMQHAETLRLACTSAAEAMFNDGPGAEEAKYQRALADSMRRDQRSIRAATVGIAGDSEPQDNYHDYYSGIDSVTVGGVSYN